MAGLDELLRRARQTPGHARAKALAKSDYKLLADLVRVRKDNGLTQDDVAERLGITQQAVSKMESYDSDPQLSTLRRYAHAIGALVDHKVERDTGQLSALQGVHVMTTYSAPPFAGWVGEAALSANRTYPSNPSFKLDFALAA